MAKETEVILRSILFQVMTARSLEELEIAIMAMCSEDDISTVKGHIAELRERQSAQNSKKD